MSNVPDQRLSPCRALAPLLLLGLFLGGIAGAGRTAAAGPVHHPLYQDGNTLRWYVDLDEARVVAAREGKLIVVAVSVPRSRACETAIGLIGDTSIRGRIARIAIGYHVDARRSVAFKRDFRRNLRSTAYYPWVGFFTAGSSWVSGFASSRRTGRAEMRRRFLTALARAESVQGRLRPKTAASPAAPQTSSTRVRSTPASPAVRPKRSPRSGSGPVWYEKISEAKAAARAQGKFILVTSTKPSCGLCKKLINKIVPQVWTRMSQGCVFYVYDITDPESGAIDRLVRANHRGHRLMPLAGFMTADSRWLHGFYGGTDPRQLMADYRMAQQAAQRR